jgi:HSP90 family molecular chaperone
VVADTERKEIMEKLSKKQKFELVLSRLTDEYERKFIEHEIELLEKKNAHRSSKPTEKQEANMEIKDAIVEYLGSCEEGVTVTHLMKNVPEFADLSNQKLSALLRQLREEQVVKSEKGKGGVTLFSLV